MTNDRTMARLAKIGRKLIRSSGSPNEQFDELCHQLLSALLVVQTSCELSLKEGCQEPELGGYRRTVDDSEFWETRPRRMESG